MNKLLLGCLVLLVLLVGGAGFVVYQVAPAFMEAGERVQAAQVELQELDAQHPFDVATTSFDAGRFATFLQLRAELKGELAELTERMEALRHGDTGFLDTLRSFAAQGAQIFELLPRQLAAASMGPTEFGYHSRLLQAALAAPGSGPLATDFANRASEFKGAYSEIAKQDNSLPADLDDLLKPDLSDTGKTFPPGVVLAAREVLDAQPDLAIEALVPPDVETILMRMPLEKHMGEASGGWDVDVHVDETPSETPSAAPSDAPNPDAPAPGDG